MGKLISLLVIIPVKVACKQILRPYLSSDGDPELVKIEDKSYLKNSSSVRRLISSSILIRDIYMPNTSPPTLRNPTPGM